jgi:probable lipoprotein NlpC
MSGPTKHWSEDFLGLPFKGLGRTRDGVDCWGLVRLVLGEFGIHVPSYAEGYASAEERAEISGLINGAKPLWHMVEDPRELDVIIFRRGRLECHVGLVVRPGLMLHVTDDRPSCIENYLDWHWANRIKGFWRHEDLLGEVRT